MAGGESEPGALSGPAPVALRQRYPGLGDRLLVELVNGIQVSRETIAFRKRRGVFGRLLDQLLLRSDSRQLLLDSTLLEVQESIFALVQEIQGEFTLSMHALVETQSVLMRVVDRVRELEARSVAIAADLGRLRDLLEQGLQSLAAKLTELDARVLTLEAQAEVDRVLAACRSGHAYRDLHWLWQAALLPFDLFSGKPGLREAQSGPDEKLRRYLADRLVHHMESRGVSEPITLTVAIEQAIADSPEIDRWVLGMLLDVRGLSRDLTAVIPCRFVLATAIELSGLLDAESFRSPVECAWELARRDQETELPRLLSRRDLATRLATEAAEYRLRQQQVIDPPPQLVPHSAGGRSDGPVLSRRPSRTRRKDGGLSTAGGSAASPGASAGETPGACGLVLAGGGARGAYHAGAVRALAEAGFRFDLVAGASIGALCGAVLCAARDPDEGAYRLDRLWGDLSGTEILVPWDETPSPEASLDSVLDTRPIERLLRQAFDIDDLRRGTPLWVSITRVPGVTPRGGKWSTAAASLLAGQAEWVLVNELGSDDLIFEVLLASAAIPVLFPARQIETGVYVDGGVKDNVPVRALQQRTPGRVIVVHLDNGVLWDRSAFPQIEVIEIRPREPLRGSVWHSGFSSLLDFDARTIERLKRLGYEETKAVIEELEAAQVPGRLRREAFEHLLRSTSLMVEQREADVTPPRASLSDRSGGRRGQGPSRRRAR